MNDLGRSQLPPFAPLDDETVLGNLYTFDVELAVAAFDPALARDGASVVAPDPCPMFPVRACVRRLAASASAGSVCSHHPLRPWVMMLSRAGSRHRSVV